MMNNHSDNVLSFSSVTKQFPSVDGVVTAVEDVSFDLKAGATAALLGPSGSGKTTLLSLAAGLDDPTAGTVALAGARWAGLDEDVRARRRLQLTGFVFQSFQLITTLNALENVMVPLELAGRKDATERSRDLLERVGLGHRLHHYPAQLSGGEQQRVAIARAFAPNPSILFADEPTGNLDHASAARVVDLLFTLNREQGTTLLLVTHDRELAARCGRTLRLKGGRMEAEEAMPS